MPAGVAFFIASKTHQQATPPFCSPVRRPGLFTAPGATSLTKYHRLWLCAPVRRKESI